MESTELFGKARAGANQQAIVSEQKALAARGHYEETRRAAIF